MLQSLVPPFHITLQVVSKPECVADKDRPLHLAVERKWMNLIAIQIVMSSLL